jgi:hypothetical protein
MDDAFSLIATQMPPRRRISPSQMRSMATLGVAVALLVAFAMFVNGQQRAADARRSTKAAQQEAAREAEVQAVTHDLIDSRAREIAKAALATAMQVAATTSLDQASPGALSALNHELVFVDGPSTAPSVVSVFSGAAGWSAAVHGSGETCYWVAVSLGGDTTYGTGSPCTGLAALGADRASW